jgi:membrane-associated phospholipid phosphatase
MLPLFHNLLPTLRIIFSPRNILLQTIACILTYIIVISGFDWEYFKLVHGSTLSMYLSPAIGIGGIVPVFGIPLLYILAKIRKNKESLMLTWMLAQAAALGWLISSTYKAFTGRVQPPHSIVDTMADMSLNWNFGFLKHGIFWGWPSSHTTVAFAMSFALIARYQNNKKVFWGALLYASYIGLGISMQIHWFSELVAGAIIGTVIGLAVGTSFRKSK